MKQPTFLEGAVLALITALSGSVLFGALNLLLPVATTIRVLISLLSLAYTGYLMTRSRKRLGRVTTFSVWLLTTVAGWVMLPGVLHLLLLHCAFIWIVRSFFQHSGLPAAIADLALCSLSLAAAAWATLQSGSIFLTIWCFFLTQALFTAIPKSWRGKQPPAEAVNDNFYHAYQTAQKALSKLVSS